MKYIEAPNYDIHIATLDPETCLFLGGSISNARDWQADILKMKFADYTLLDRYNVFNPRRKAFDISDPKAEQEQILWEHHCINHLCRNLIFWFSSETVAPITLFEYGKALKTHDHSKIFVGVDPAYPRKNDIIIQTRLENPDLEDRIVHDLYDLHRQVYMASFARSDIVKLYRNECCSGE